MKKQIFAFAAVIACAFGTTACTQEVIVPEWVKTANIYEVNVRQYSPEGTFSAFARDVPRLKSLGVEIVWFMPIHPISREKRKGYLGSYYSVADYKAVNPEFGTMSGFKSLVDDLHSSEMKVLIDWVPNHTGWDHPWIKQHPEFYQKGSDGKITDPINPATGKSWGWTDVAALDYSNKGLHEAMLDAMMFWVKEVGVDGFRVDVAGEVPIEFWRKAIPKLRSVNPELFMLAESEEPALRNEQLFNMTYGWSFHTLMKDIAQGKKNLSAIEEWYKEDRAKFTEGLHMHFTQNHDENSWAGTEDELFGPAKDAMAVLATMYDGMPLLYNGQEAGLNKRLRFFEKDTINWGDYPRRRMYETLLGVRRAQKALWGMGEGGEPVRLKTNDDSRIFAFKREKDDNRVIVLLNLSNTEVMTSIEDRSVDELYREAFLGVNMQLGDNVKFALTPWSYMVLVLVPEQYRNN
jgi:glycosidase